MKNLARACGLVACVLGVTAVGKSAFAQSTRDPIYVQGHGIGYMVFANRGGGSGFPMEVSAGYHFSGKHEGFVLGAAQKVIFSFERNGGALLATVARAGYDIAIPIKDMELTIAPYGIMGVAYGSNLGSAYFHFAFGAEGRFFPFTQGAAKGFFGVARPLEIGFIPTGNFTAIPLTTSAGAGFAF